MVAQQQCRYGRRPPRDACVLWLVHGSFSAAHRRITRLWMTEGYNFFCAAVCTPRMPDQMICDPVPFIVSVFLKERSSTRQREIILPAGFHPLACCKEKQIPITWYIVSNPPGYHSGSGSTPENWEGHYILLCAKTAFLSRWYSRSCLYLFIFFSPLCSIMLFSVFVSFKKNKLNVCILRSIHCCTLH